MCKKTFVAEAHGEPKLEQEEINLLDVVAPTEDTKLCMLPHARRRSVSPQRYSRWRTSHMQVAWGAHFFVTLLVLVYSSMDNDGR